MRSLDQCITLLLDGRSPDAVSRVFTHPKRFWVVQGDEADAAQLLNVALAEIDNAARMQGLHVVMALSYEAASAFPVLQGLPMSLHVTAQSSPYPAPWLQAIAFDAPMLLSRTEALKWLRVQAKQVVCQVDEATPCVSEAQFVHNVQHIQQLIEQGQTYQVNYTFPMQSCLRAFVGQMTADAAWMRLYGELVQDLHIAFGALLLWPYNTVLSCSPELLVQMTPDTLTCRPMKGTAAVTNSEAENQQRAAALALDPKNRAENVMIVDLMRNDLSKIDGVRNVQVPQLFEVQRYGTVLQMTSTVEACLNPQYPQPKLQALLSAVFPCGSITGAPKRQTMQIIQDLEPSPRGVYCGAIGYVAPASHDTIHAIFNVPIRTLQSTAAPTVDAMGLHHWPIHLAVGAGITHGSNPADEWQECLLKAKFFNQHAKPFELIETMRIDRAGHVALLPLHVARLQRSAKDLGFAVPSMQAIEQSVAHGWQVALAADSSLRTLDFLRLRLACALDGRLSTHITKPEALLQTVRFALHTKPIESSNPWLRHKTSVRDVYNQAVAQAKSEGYFDYVFFNERGELTEGARSNILLQINGQWYTPPLHCGVLAGVQRQKLMGDWGVIERIVTVQDLARAERIVLCNALYGALDAQWMRLG